MKTVLREKYRYIVVLIDSEERIDRKEFEGGMREEVLRILGEIGYSKVMPRVVYFSRGTGIIRVRREGCDSLRIALPLISSIDGKRTHIQTVFTSGTVRKAREMIRDKISIRAGKRK